jgi:hypothetical protein
MSGAPLTQPSFVRRDPLHGYQAYTGGVNVKSTSYLASTGAC